VALCFSRFGFLVFSLRRVGGGVPRRSRASERTAVAALNGFGLRLRAMSLSSAVSAAGSEASHLRFDQWRGQDARAPAGGTPALRHYAIIFAVEEREFYDERQERKVATMHCPHCKQPGEYEVNWLVRTKKRQIPPRADERDRARFAKMRNYMVRRDDMVACKNLRCRKRFEISSLQSVAFLD